MAPSLLRSDLHTHPSRRSAVPCSRTAHPRTPLGSRRRPRSTPACAIRMPVAIMPSPLPPHPTITAMVILMVLRITRQMAGSIWITRTTTTRTIRQQAPVLRLVAGPLWVNRDARTTRILTAHVTADMRHLPSCLVALAGSRAPRLRVPSCRATREVSHPTAASAMACSPADLRFAVSSALPGYGRLTESPTREQRARCLPRWGISRCDHEA